MRIGASPGARWPCAVHTHFAPPQSPCCSGGTDRLVVVPSRVGSGRQWRAERVQVCCEPAPSFAQHRSALDARPLGGAQGGWRLQFVIADKLKRPITWTGDVRPDEYHVAAISGMVRGPPRLSGGSPDAAALLGEFRGWKLE